MNIRKRILTILTLALFFTCSMFAQNVKRGGVVNYNLHFAALQDMCGYVLSMMTVVGYLLYAIAAIISIYSSCVIYIKMNTGEDGIVKNVMMLVGAILFLIGATIIFPSMFGIMHAGKNIFN